MEGANVRRDEAISEMTTALAKGDTLSAGIVDGLCRLGILKLDEPKSVDTRFAEACYDANVKNHERDLLMQNLRAANLKIIDAGQG